MNYYALIFIFLFSFYFSSLLFPLSLFSILILILALITIAFDKYANGSSIVITYIFDNRIEREICESEEADEEG